MKHFIFCIVILCSFGCSFEKEKVTNPKDYQRYLNRAQLAGDNSIAQEMKFWKERLKDMPGDEASIVRLAGLNAELFKEKGIIEHLITSDSLYTLILKKDTLSVDILQALSANAITQHQFKRAQAYAEKASEIGNKRSASLLLLADVYLERGDIFRASVILDDFKNKNSFAYLIRHTKVKDHEGKLDTAILLMEKAYERIADNPQLSQWTLSNLGDMYGHAGRIQDAYNTYLKVLQNEPTNNYALKGIAWILLSHEHNTRTARSIIESLANRQRMPEAHLMLAEIADMEGNHAEKMTHINKFISMTTEPGYKTMYNKYLANVYMEELENIEAALDIAEQEIISRPTPQSFDLKAWAYYNAKEYRKALEIAHVNVEEQTFEPGCLYHLGMIYLANGDKKKAEQYLSEALTAEFELGPSTTKKIQQALSNL
jgi:tetratricopeptide (TPR) repeat protein